MSKLVIWFVVLFSFRCDSQSLQLFQWKHSANCFISWKLCACESKGTGEAAQQWSAFWSSCTSGNMGATVGWSGM